MSESSATKDSAKFLAPSVPAVEALKQHAAGGEPFPGLMERTVSEDIRCEREDLREAAEYSQNVILDLGIDGLVRWVSPSWPEVMGSPPDSVIGKPVADWLVTDKNVFERAAQTMRQDDARSQIVRFSVPAAQLASSGRKQPNSKQAFAPDSEEASGDDAMVMFEGQGIMVYDRVTGAESHTMWMIKPYVIREVTIDLPDVLVEALGIGAEMLARYLTGLAEDGVADAKNLPTPPPVLCRICERQISQWWFEKHTELCLQEHTAERDVQFAQEALTDHRQLIVKVLDALEAQTRQPRATANEPSIPPAPEYKGMPIGSSPIPSSTASSGRSSPASPPSRSRERSAGGFGHHRARSFAIRRPIPRIVELVLDLCDTALEINMPAVKDSLGQPDGEFRTQSPVSESRVSQVLQWQSPSTSTIEQEAGLAALCGDTEKLAKSKVDAVQRYRRILEYSERIRVEYDILVRECIEAAVDKAARIAAGELSDSSEDQGKSRVESRLDGDLTNEPDPTHSGVFPCSLEGSAMLPPPNLTASTASLTQMVQRAEVRSASTAASTRSSSPHGSKTPRSTVNPGSSFSLNKRHSIHVESDAGAESDSSNFSSILSARRAESPVSDLSLSRVATSRERKRRSLILPHVMTSRQHSPARSMPPPSSPLRVSKARIPSTEASQSPVTSPILSTSEFSSPAICAPHLHQLHRRQSSAASSEAFRPTSPRLGPVSSNPQPRPVPPSIKDFEIIKPISKGAFGSVYLSKKKSTSEYFAIKVLKKADMVAKNQVTNVKAERAIMMWQGESDFVAKLYWTFSSKEYLYLVMEYLNGGDCASLIKVLGGLPEDWAKKYLAEVVLGVEHLHSRGIVHRDLKPDNLLIDQKGHLKLTDFGLSRMGLVRRQKRALSSQKDEAPVPDLLKQGPFQRSVSVESSRSASFDLHGNSSPSQTPSLTPANPETGPSYFSLSRETTGKESGNKSDSEAADALHSLLRKFSLDDGNAGQHPSPMDDESRSGGEQSPDVNILQHVASQPIQMRSTSTSTPPAGASSMVPPNLALFDPEDATRRFVGTPDYLAPETVNGIGQDELSDWWSLGCILFEFLYGYPPFHANTPDKVFQNILNRSIDWPPEEADDAPAEAKDLMNKLMCTDPAKRLGANADETFASGGEEIRAHPFFEGINWQTLREDEASFIPVCEDPEDTEYFDARGAVLQNFASEFEDTAPPNPNPNSGDYPERPHDALSRVRSQINSVKRGGLMPLHIPPHVREGRSRRLSEPVPADDFGSFSFKNLPALEKANKDVIQKLRAEALQIQSKGVGGMQSPAVSSPTPSLDSSPILPHPTLKRTMSHTKGSTRPGSPLMLNQVNFSPNRISQPSSPLLVQFSAGQHHERRKTSSGSSSLSHQTSSSLQPGSFFDAPRLATNLKTSSSASSPIKLAKSPGPHYQMSHERSASTSRPHQLHPMTHSKVTSPRGRSQTLSSQESEDVIKDLKPNQHKRRSQVIEASPSSSDNEDSRQKALLRVQRRRQSSRRLSQINLGEGPTFRPLDVLICEDHPVSRLVMEKLVEKLRCRAATATNGPEAIRFATSEVKFDIIMMEYKLPQINGADVARMLRKTKNANSTTPIVAVTGYLKELPPNHFFDGLIDKPPTIAKLTEILGRLCQWRPPPLNWTPASFPIPNPLNHPRTDSVRTEDSPTSNASSFGIAPFPSSSYRGSSREDSISSSFFSEMDRTESLPTSLSKQSMLSSSTAESWREAELTRALEGLGITDDHNANLARDPDSRQVSGSMQMPIEAHSMPPPHPPPQATKKATEWPRLERKRSAQRTSRADSADSGDDEDEELGDRQIRAKSPKGGAAGSNAAGASSGPGSGTTTAAASTPGRPRGTSKLAQEMLRTNSRGSVVSVGDTPGSGTPGGQDLASSPPPSIVEDVTLERTLQLSGVLAQNLASTPPEHSPGIAVEGVDEMDMLGPESVTPKPSHAPSADGEEGILIDPDPTPRAERVGSSNDAFLGRPQEANPKRSEDV